MPSWVGTHGGHLIELLALIFARREYKAKAERIVNWAMRFGIGGVKAGWWREKFISSDYEDPVLKVNLRTMLASYGLRQLLTIIAQIFWSEPGDIIMIEEPVASLHPESQLILQELFAEAAKDGKYIIYTTHSLFLVLSLSRVVRKDKDLLDKIAVYDVEKAEKGAQVKKLELSEHGFIKGWIPSFFKVEDGLFQEWARTLEG